ncbi:MAG: transposase [Candidatus Carbobacillus altaicus]|nr:transposase [Candidatus Carbobacillus altaicus]
MLGSAYSPATISDNTETATEEILVWHWRPLQKRLSVLYLDALFDPLRRDTVEQESIYWEMGVNLDGYREILSFPFMLQRRWSISKPLKSTHDGAKGV